ncbi:expressed unknown protein [Seminavis robusta]|uniref:Uncharacterized protein n=1 Tax=Seminavis robusta TaxID=568900 RepID=A0A9N8DVS1_9STRA|nr:expressed unknown protein [Seminavis robusta]|eukprot:Sro318_g116060.1 n/a (181) ;mRNA; r:71599-72141
MAKAKNEPAIVANDGAIVAVLLLMMVALAAEMVFCIILYATNQKRIAKLISGWSNVGNAMIHILLAVVLYSDTERCLQAGIDDAENFAGPLVLVFINGAIGLKTLTSGGPLLPLGWNVFVAITGSLVPIVWPKFVDVGLSTWPYLIVVMWFGIFCFESLAFTASCAWYGLRNSEEKAKTS